MVSKKSPHEILHVSSGVYRAYRYRLLYSCKDSTRNPNSTYLTMPY